MLPDTMLARLFRVFLFLFVLYIVITLLDAEMVRRKQNLLADYLLLQEKKTELQVEYQNLTSLDGLLRRAREKGLEPAKYRGVVK
ncbi:MAG: hypothetical protein V2G48_02475 [bacterium JZ-2024 1]